MARFLGFRVCGPGFKFQVCDCVHLFYKCFLRIPGPVGTGDMEGQQQIPPCLHGVSILVRETVNK